MCLSFCPSVRLSVCPSVRLSVCPSVRLSKAAFSIVFIVYIIILRLIYLLSHISFPLIFMHQILCVCLLSINLVLMPRRYVIYFICQPCLILPKKILLSAKKCKKIHLVKDLAEEKAAICSLQEGLWRFNCFFIIMGSIH